MTVMVPIADLLLDELEAAEASRDVYVVAFERGKRARIARLPRSCNPYPAGRLANSWDGGWVFGTRGWK